MPSQTDSAPDRGRRYFIAAGTATYDHLDEKNQLPSVEADLARMEALFVGRLGYERALPELSLNPTATQLRQVGRWLRGNERRSDDLVVFYYSGHGEVDDDQHYLCTQEAEFDYLLGTAFPTAELARMLYGSKVQQVLILLDTCYAGRGSGDIASLLPRMIGSFRLDDESNAGIYVVAAAGPKEPAYPNLFSEAFVQAVTAPDASYSQPTVEYLALDAVVDNIKRRLGEQRKQRTELSTSRVQTLSRFLPNPYFNPNALLNGEELFSQSWLEDRLQEATVVAGPRYTPPIHVELPIAQHFESLARTPAFFIRIKHMLRDMKKAYEGIHLTNLGDAMELLASTLNGKAHLFFTTLLRLDESLVEPIPWMTVTEQADQVLRAAHDCLKQVDELKRQEKEEKSQDHKKLFDTSQHRGHRDISNDIDQFMGKVHQFRRFAQGVDAKLTNLHFP